MQGEGLRRILKQSVVEDIVELGNCFDSELAQDSLIQAYRRLVEEEASKNRAALEDSEENLNSGDL